MIHTEMTAHGAAATAVRPERCPPLLQMRLRAVRAVIIDLDGTMVDTAPDFQLAVNRMRAERHMAPLSLQSVSTCIGKGSEHLVRAVLRDELAPDELERRFEAALAAYQRHYKDINGDQAQVYAGVREGLDAMRAGGLLLACVTNKPHALASRLLALKGLSPYFKVVYGGDSLPLKKPHPLPILRTCADFGLRPEQAVVIGDSSNDAQAARAAGCAVLNVPYGYNHGEPIASADADAVVADLLAAARMILS